jgi:Sec-independent protein translocase protein TatA
VGKAIRNFKGATKEDEPLSEPDKIEDKKET